MHSSLSVGVDKWKIQYFTLTLKLPWNKTALVCNGKLKNGLESRILDGFILEQTHMSDHLHLTSEEQQNSPQSIFHWCFMGNLGLAV